MTNIRCMILLYALFAFSMSAAAYDFVVDGIYYEIKTDSTVSVTYASGEYGSYSNAGTVTIPETVTYEGVAYTVTAVGISAFRSSQDLYSVILPTTITSVGNYSFANCVSLEDVNLPTNLSSIGSSAFLSCRTLKSIELPEGLTSIGNYAFRSCYALTSIDIPNTVKSIGTRAFSFDYGLTSVSLPHKLTNIAEGCFYNCESLLEVSIPASVSSIDSAAFEKCYALSDIYCSGTVPPEATVPDATFADSTLHSATLHVPAEALSEYSNTRPWSEFSNIVGDMEAETYYAPVHRPVYEEYTGMWCGYCPRGAVWMAIMKDLYPEDWIGISYHYRDDLQMLDKSDFPLSVSSYPSGYFDRQGSNYTSSLSSKWLSRCSVDAPAGIEAEASVDADYENILCTAKLVFAEDADGDDYEVEFILVADSLHNDSWYQKNFYSGDSVSSYEEYWQVYLEGDSKIYGLYFNDVVMASSRVTSTGNISLPSSDIAAMDTVTVTYTQPISTLTTLESDMGGSIQNLKEVALLIDRTSGEVMNAHQTHVQLEDATSGISKLSYHHGNEWVAYGVKGRIVIIAQEATRFAIHTLGGQLHARASAAAGEELTISAPPGIYLVNGQKVLVRK